MEKLRDIQREYVDRLTPKMGEREAMQHFLLALERLEGGQRKDVMLDRETEQGTTYREWLEAVLDGEPIQYVLGKAYFDGMELEVDHSVLIPRPETEELVRWVAEENADRALRILDLGTGSGCIALALARRLPKAQLMACDVSSNALDIARRNADRLGQNLLWMHCNALEHELPKVELIVSNPPYIPMSERGTMADWVVRHEPEIALFVPDDDPLLFYRRLMQQSRTTGCTCYVEIHEDRRLDLEEELLIYGLDYEFRKDLQGKYRMLRFRP